MFDKRTAFWWRGKPNFGDLLTPLLLERFSDVRVSWAPVEKAQILGVGSVLDLLPKAGWTGTVLGSGVLRPTAKVDLSAANVLAVRGPLTARLVKGIKWSSIVYGDLGLLADELVFPPPLKRFKLGIVPHWSDTQLEFRPEFKGFEPLIIRPSGDPLEVVRAIGSCEKIVSSSLHGIILADAFGIPRRTEMTEQFAKEGGDFKFRDYNASIEVPFAIGKTQYAPRSKVQDRQHELYDLLRSL